MTDYAVKDSGQRQEFASGMVRDTQDGKIDFTLVLDGPLLERWADHLTKGAGKYAPRNWMLASGDAEYQRFRQSAFRHFVQWMRGDADEDHAAAVVFNLNGAEYVKAQAEPSAAEGPAENAPCFDDLVIVSTTYDQQGPCRKQASPPVVEGWQAAAAAAVESYRPALDPVESYRAIEQTEGGFGFVLEDHAKAGPKCRC